MFWPEAGGADRCCLGCGLDYPGGLDRCPQCGGRSSVRQSPRPVFLPLRVPAGLLMAALAAVIVVVAARLAVRELGLDVGVGGASRRYLVMQIDKITDVTLFGLGIVFVVWFRRARLNAEHRGWAQRRAPAWTFWGWVLPMANLFVPFQLLGDIWRAGLPADRRGRTAWLPVLWWTSFLLSESMSARDYFIPHLSGDTSTLSMCMLTMSAVTLIAIIRLVSAGPVGSPHPGRLPAQPPVLAG